MSGINGILTWYNRHVDINRIKYMNHLINHRGPDNSGLYVKDQVALGFQRLSIIDLETGNQPIPNETETCWLIFDGEIYNYRELERDLALRGHRFRTHSDAEVVVHAYEEWGKHCVNKLRGMFSFAIWDERDRELFCARDPFGIKPFYYTHQADAFVFSSEIKAILGSGEVQPEVTSSAFLNYLTFQYVPNALTMFKHIHKLPPGHWMSVNAQGDCRQHRYWAFTFVPEEGRSLSYYIEGLRDVLRESVKTHSQSDVSVGTLLSSGIDSAAITSLMCEQNENPVPAFGIGFADYPVNEAEMAQHTASQLHTHYFNRALDADQFSSAIPKVVWHLDEPLADPSAVPLYYAAELARSHVKVALSGEGADELFGGYGIYREPRALAPFNYLSPKMKTWIRRQAKKLPYGLSGRSYLLRGTTPLSQRFVGNAFLFDEQSKQNITDLPAKLLSHYADPFTQTEATYLESEEWDLISQMQYVDIQHWLPGDILLKADKLSMAHALELRTPFLDIKVAEFAAKIPASLRVKGGTTKYILREAMKGIVPQSVVQRPKLGFPVPLNAWMRGPLYDLVGDTLSSGDLSPWVNQAEAMHLLEQHRQSRLNYSRKLWSLYMFAVWYQQYIGQAIALTSMPDMTDRETISIDTQTG